MSRNTATDAKLRLSREQGTIIKDWGGRLPFALVYPNSYYIGMSNLGAQAIYGLLNGYPNAVCERVFLDKPGKKPVTPVSVESGRPLPDFPVIAFSISYELDYFNVVQILRASGIPIYARDRNETHPLVIAGGPCITANPMPLSPFFDCLCAGEAEAILPEMLPVLGEGIGGARQDLLDTLSKLPGIYVPLASNKTPVARQHAADLDSFPVHSIVLTPDTELGDLYLIEVERGCSWGCRFCMVSTTFSPMRFRSIGSLLAQAQEGLRYRKRIGLVGPAVTDLPQLEELLVRLRGLGAELSISSLRIKPLPTIALREMAKAGAKSIALAPEAGSQRLRQTIRKNFSEDDILKAVARVAEEKVEHLKLYFMIGLPTETDEDIEEIIQLSLKCKAVLERDSTPRRITLSVSPFVPKAGTPFQWLPGEQLAVLRRRLARLKNQLTKKGIIVSGDSPAWSQVQGILARGDDRLAEALAETEEVSLSGWRKALEKCRLNADEYAYKKWDVSEKLPWSVVDSGARPGHLERELERALR